MNTIGNYGESILQYNWPGIDQVEDRGTTMSEIDYLYTTRPYLLIMVHVVPISFLSQGTGNSA